MNKQIEQVELKLIEVIQRLEEVDGVVLKIPNQDDRIFIEGDCGELYKTYLNKNNFIKGYINNNNNNNTFEINKIYIQLKNIGQVILEVL